MWPRAAKHNLVGRGLDAPGVAETFLNCIRTVLSSSLWDIGYQNQGFSWVFSASLGKCHNINLSPRWLPFKILSG